VGLGALAWARAMGIRSFGLLAKLVADTIQDVDRKPLDALAAAGSNRTQIFVGGILPQVVTAWLSLTLFRLDINVRRSVILGFVGAGGIGFELQRVLGQLVYPRGLTIVAMIFVFILVVEQLSAWVRKTLVGSEGVAANPFRRQKESKRQANAVTAVPVPVLGPNGPVRVPGTRLRVTKFAGLVMGAVLFLISAWQVGLTPAS